MPRIVETLLLSRHREWLAGATSCPQWTFVVPPSEACGKAPSTDTGEKVTLGISVEVFRVDISD
jgi:hypothetical protein